MTATLRELGFVIGEHDTTPRNHICDVEGVAVGHRTLHVGTSVHTGITIVRPHGRDVVRSKAFAGFHCANGYGKFVGSTQIDELGSIETLVGLTNTLAVGTVMQELARYHVACTNDPGVVSLNVVVGETNDYPLNDIRSLPIAPSHVHEAIEDVNADNLAQGSVGAGTGTLAFGFKAGIGSAARSVAGVRIGVLVQSNYWGHLALGGRTVWKVLGISPHTRLREQSGSCVILVATDACLMPDQLRRLARRATAGMVRTGGFFAHGSGDYALCWSTHPCAAKEGDKPMGGPFLEDGALDPLFVAVSEAVEEAVWNSMTLAAAMAGFQATVPSLSAEQAMDAWQQLGE